MVLTQRQTAGLLADDSFAPRQDVLADLKLPPDATEVPVPRYFIADRAKVRILTPA